MNNHSRLKWKRKQKFKGFTNILANMQCKWSKKKWEKYEIIIIIIKCVKASHEIAIQELVQYLELKQQNKYIGMVYRRTTKKYGKETH